MSTLCIAIFQRFLADPYARAAGKILGCHFAIRRPQPEGRAHNETPDPCLVVFSFWDPPSPSPPPPTSSTFEDEGSLFFCSLPHKRNSSSTRPPPPQGPFPPPTPLPNPFYSLFYPPFANFSTNSELGPSTPFLRLPERELPQYSV